MRLFVRTGEGDDASWCWSLAVDVDGLVHWRMHYPDVQGTLPLCYEFTGRHAAVPAKRAKAPTCVHCILAPMKPFTG